MRNIAKYYYACAGAALVVALVFVFGGVRQLARNTAYSFSMPAQTFLWNAGLLTRDALYGATHPVSLQKEIRALRLENASLKLDDSLLQELKKENDALRAMQDITLAREYATVAADAVAKELADDILVLNRGSGDGISEGMPVITSSRVLAGRVIESAPGFSRVLLLSSKNSSFDAKVAGKEVVGIVRGKGAGRALLDLIPQNANIAKGDPVATSALSGMFPDNLLVGTIQDVRANDADPFQQASLSLSYSIGEAGPLLIITSYGSR